MTEKQKYLEACNFAIMQLTKKGSCSVVMNIGTEDQFVVDWKDVGKWLNKEYEQEPTIKNDLSSGLEKNSKKLEKRTTKNDLGVDCIKKSDAINIIQDMRGLARADVISDAVNRIITMPPVTPQEPRKGHWIRVAGGSLIDDYRCDCCNHQPPIRKVGSTWGWDFTDYCPNCGAKMESEDKK